MQHIILTCWIYEFKIPPNIDSVAPEKTDKLTSLRENSRLQASANIVRSVF